LCAIGSGENFGGQEFSSRLCSFDKQFPETKYHNVIIVQNVEVGSTRAF